MTLSSDLPLVANQLPVSLEFPPLRNESAFIQTLTNTLQQIADTVNTKEGALYLLQELATFQLYYITADPQSSRPTYRRTYDLVSLNGGAIAVGATAIALTGSNLINGINTPTLLNVTATGAGPVYYGTSSPDVYCNFDNTVPAAQVINVTNNTPGALTQATLVFEYTKY